MTLDALQLVGMFTERIAFLEHGYMVRADNFNVWQSQRATVDRTLVVVHFEALGDGKLVMVRPCNASKEQRSRQWNS